MHCNKEFEKDRREHDRQVRNGKNNFFCSLSCTATFNNYKLDKGNKMKGNLRIGGEKIPRTLDRKLKYYIRKAKSRAKDKNIETNIDVEYLKNLWESQNGKCVYSGIELKITDYHFDKGRQDQIHLASLDRIDSSKGYVKGNVQFISASLNYAKNDMDDNMFREGLKELFKAYSNNS